MPSPDDVEPQFHASVESSSPVYAEPDSDNLLLDILMLAQHAFQQYEARGGLKDLEFSIESFRVAMDVTDDDNPEKANILANLGVTLQMRFERIGESMDLEESITLKQLADALTPYDHPTKPSRLSNLAASVFTRFEREGRAEDHEEAIVLWTRAIELVPDSHPDKPTLLNNLGTSLRVRYERSGDSDDLEKAIELQDRAAGLIPDSHPHKPSLLVNLGNALERQFNRLGNLEDLERAIALKTRGVDLTPDGHPSKPGYLNNAGLSFQTRFARLGSLEDLGSAITLKARAVDLTPDGYPDKPAQLNNLSNSLQDRYARTGVLKDLEKAIAHQLRAVELTTDRHPLKPSYFSNLGIKLQMRSQQSGSLDDLDEAITYYTKAMKLTPEEHHDKHSWLYNLGNSLRERFDRVGVAADLEEAIRCSTRSLGLLSGSHSERARTLRLLGAIFVTRLSSPYAQADDATRAMEAFLEAMQHTASPPLGQLRASGLYVQLLSKFSHLFATPPKVQLLEAYKNALDLIPQCIWLGNNVSGRYTSKELSVVQTIVNDAATAAVSAGEYCRALEWLEAGRAVVWSQILQLRTPLDDLRRLHPQLAEDLCATSQALQLNASPQSNPLPVSSGVRSTLDEQAQSSHGYAMRYAKLIEEIRRLEGFEDFMRPKTFPQLVGASSAGPVVLINVHETRCDALVLCQGGDVVHVPLPQFSYGRAEKLHRDLWSILATRHLRGRFRDELESDGGDRDDRGGYLPGKGGKHDPTYKILGDLWVLVVKPILDAIHTLSTIGTSSLPHITWCPTGPLTFLPLHAAGIYNERGALETIMDYAVSSYTPTLEALLKPRTQISPTTCEAPRVLIVSQPATPNCNPIPGTTTEAAIVMSLVGQSKSRLQTASSFGTADFEKEERRPRANRLVHSVETGTDRSGQWIMITITYFYGPEPEDDVEVEPEPMLLSDKDTVLQKIGSGPGHLCHTMKMTRELGQLSGKEIALKMVEVINFMAKKGLDVATFLHYLSGNLQVPVHMESEEGVHGRPGASFRVLLHLGPAKEGGSEVQVQQEGALQPVEALQQA
ncbi:hypothetical protein BDY19DRAFT_1029974 [Irpex rosettiformis]|uniref:Uncharacterized protein n=1 Tax=Irpex rosettiformis TaxID=378272 RepID=A0ACB8TP41_9APHY|nr:hypothetical protein BDY19DRAFT_1029974 [Irpex rosettiformis]